jgi:hypothetical protein
MISRRVHPLAQAARQATTATSPLARVAALHVLLVPTMTRTQAQPLVLRVIQVYSVPLPQPALRFALSVALELTRPVPSCVACTAGSYNQLSTGTSGCTACSAGTYNSLTTGTSKCTACVVGLYGNVVSSSTSVQCTSCVSGSYNSLVTGTSKCTACAAGKYGASTLAFNCLNCALGTYNSLTTGTGKCTSRLVWTS